MSGRPPDDGAAESWTVSRLNDRARRAIEQAFGMPLWVVGELQSFDRNGKTSHAYFELVERPRPQADPSAKIACVCFFDTRVAIGRKLKSFPDIAFRDGLQVRLLARPTVYGRHGKFQLIVDDLDPYFTEGELRRRREEVVAEMRRRGIARRNLGRKMPRLPRRVALITSTSGDARRDFEAELAQSGYRFEVALFDAVMQGNRTEASILRALRVIESRSDEFDVVCIVRGGGARSDLAYFDTEELAEAVCLASTKVVVGIGHHRDRCALDDLALSAKTPTAAASLLIEQFRVAETSLRELEERLRSALERDLARKRARWRDSAFMTGRLVTRSLRTSRARFDRMERAFSSAALRSVRDSDERLRRAESQLSERARAFVDRSSRAVEFARRGIDRKRIERRLGEESIGVERIRGDLAAAARSVLREGDRETDAMARAIRLVHPDRVLERGFAIVRREHSIVSDTSAFAPGEHATVVMRDGRLEVEIASVLSGRDDE